ncbi:TIGR01777 family oxidoreductase [Thermodesulfobacteriota bacterium]
MKILITGATGFVGLHLARFLLEAGHEIVATGTSKTHPLSGQPFFEYVSADTTQAGPWQDQAGNAAAVINLTGRTIFHRWTKSYKQQILDSRVLTTRLLVDALPKDKATIFLSASAVGYYGDGGDALLQESAPAGTDFLAGVSVVWEKEALRAAAKKHRVVAMRFGVVLGANGGALAQMVPAYRRFAGGPLGSGRQWFSWIHMDDLTAAIAFSLATESLQGPVNFCAPGVVTSRDFAQALGKALHRPAIIKVPTFALRMAMGEMGSVLLNSQRAVPARLQEAGFTFQYPHIDEALQSLLDKG